MSNVKAITNTDMMLIKLNVEAGRPVREISALTGIEVSVVEKAIEEYGWTPSGKSETPDDLMSQEIKKHKELSPLYMQLEVLMLAKAQDYLEELSITDEAFGVKYASLAKAVKDIRSTAPPQLLQTQTQNQNTGIQLQIINQFREDNDNNNHTVQLHSSGVSNTSV